MRVKSRFYVHVDVSLKFCLSGKKLVKFCVHLTFFTLIFFHNFDIKIDDEPIGFLQEQTMPFHRQLCVTHSLSREYVFAENRMQKKLMSIKLMV